MVKELTDKLVLEIDSIYEELSRKINKYKEGFDLVEWEYIIPFDKFNPYNTEGCIKKYNYGIKEV